MQLEQLDLPGGGLLMVYLRDCVETMPQAMERPLVLVVPGGGYSHVSAREGDPVALQFAAAGYHTAVLRYAVGDDAAHGLPLRQLAAAMVDAVRPAALICVDSLCSAEAARLGRTIQFSDTGLHPADARHARHLDAAALGVPVIAAGIPTLMDADEGADLVLTPRALDSVIAHGSALLAGILNRALQPRLSVAQLCWLTG